MPLMDLESPIDRACQDVHVAVADFVLAIVTAKTSLQALELAQRIGPLVLCLSAAEDAALTAADRLCGHSDS